MRKNVVIFALAFFSVVLLMIIILQNKLDKPADLLKCGVQEKDFPTKPQTAQKAPVNNSTPPQIPFIEEAGESVADLIVQALADKHNTPIEEISIRITQQEGDYARGGVEFAPGGPGNAGMFLASKEKGEWEIVFDGNGNPDCINLKQNYNFPESILAGFCD